MLRALSLTLSYIKLTVDEHEAVASYATITSFLISLKITHKLIYLMAEEWAVFVYCIFGAQIKDEQFA